MIEHENVSLWLPLHFLYIKPPPHFCSSSLSYPLWIMIFAVGDTEQAWGHVFWWSKHSTVTLLLQQNQQCQPVASQCPNTPPPRHFCFSSGHHILFFYLWCVSPRTRSISTSQLSEQLRKGKGREEQCTPQRDSGKLATLCLLLGECFALVWPCRAAIIISVIWTKPAKGQNHSGSSLAEKLKRQLWPRSRVSGYLKRTAQSMAPSRITFHFVGSFALLFFFPCVLLQIDLSPSSLQWLTDDCLSDLIAELGHKRKKIYKACLDIFFLKVLNPAS